MNNAFQFLDWSTCSKHDSLRIEIYFRQRIRKICSSNFARNILWCKNIHKKLHFCSSLIIYVVILLVQKVFLFVFQRYRTLKMIHVFSYPLHHFIWCFRNTFTSKHCNTLLVSWNLKFFKQMEPKIMFV